MMIRAMARMITKLMFDDDNEYAYDEYVAYAVDDDKGNAVEAPMRDHFAIGFRIRPGLDHLQLGRDLGDDDSYAEGTRSTTYGLT